MKMNRSSRAPEAWRMVDEEQHGDLPAQGRRLEAVVAALMAVSESGFVVTAQFAGVALQANNSRAGPARLLLAGSSSHC